jgi:hypothetical protein
LGLSFISWAAKTQGFDSPSSQSVGVAAKCVRGKRKEGREREREEEKHNTDIIYTHPNTCEEKRVNNNHAKSAQL